MLALTPVTLGEFLVNSTVDNYQRDPAIAMDSDGDFVLAWAGYYGPNDYMDGVFIQRYKKNGDPLGSEFLVNTYTTGNQNQVSIAMSASGGFVVTWTSQGQDGDGNGIFAQRFNADGSKLGSEFAVNTYTMGDQSASSVAMDAVGNFVVTWTSAGQDGSDFGIFAQRFDSNGIASGSEIAINSYTTGNQQASSVAMDDSGDFVVAWESHLQEGTDFSYDVYARRYGSGGPLDGSEFLVNVAINDAQRRPSVAIDATGNFVVAFHSGFDNSIRARRFDSDGIAQGAVDAQVNTTIADPQAAPAIAIDDAGNFAIAWEGDDGFNTGIFAQHFNSSGVKLGLEFQVNTSFVDAAQRLPAMAASGDGDFAIVWESVAQPGHPDTSLTGIYARRYEQVLPPNWPSDIVPDTQIHSFTSSIQEHPAVAVGTSGDIVVVWQSYGEDGEGYGIFGQRYSPLGVPRGLEFRVNAATAGDQTMPMVAANSLGGFVVVWQSGDTSGEGVYARLYDGFGRPMGGDIQVNSVTLGDQSQPDVAMDASGNFVVTWQSYGQDGSDFGIFARSYNVSGAPLAAEFQVNTYTTGAQTAPAIAVDPDSGDFAITWQSDGHDSDAGQGIFAQRFDASAMPQGTEFHVNSYTTNNQFDPDISMDTEGNFVIVWTSAFQVGATQSSIHFQRYDKLGLPAGTETHVDTGATVGGTNAAVAMDGGGKFVIAWQENDDDAVGGDPGAGILAQRYNGDGVPRNAVLRINANTAVGQVTPAIATNAVGDVAIVWTDEQGDNTTDEGIFGRRLEHLTGGFITGSDPFQVNTFTTGNQFASSVAIDSDGDFIVVWNSFNQTGTGELPGDLGYGIYAQRYDSAGNKLGTEIHINTFTTGNQQNPVVAWGPAGTFIVAWQSNAFPIGGSGLDIVAQRFDASAEPIGTEFIVNTYITGIQNDPALAIDADGDFVVVWRSFNQAGDQPDQGYGIYAQRYLASGAANGSEFRVNENTTFNQNAPTVAMDDAGNFVVAWQSYSIAEHFDIFARRYDIDGLPTSMEFRVNTYTTNAQANPSISMAPTGAFVIAWDSVNQVSATSGLDVFFQRYDNSAVPAAVGSEIKVNSYTTSEQRLPAVAMSDSGDFMVTWASRFQDGDQYGIYAQRFNAAGAEVEGESQVNVWTTASQFAPAIAAGPGGQFVITWQSTGGQDGSLAGVFGRRYALAGLTPAVLVRNFVWQNAPQRLEFTVDRNVAASLDPGDLVLENLTTNTIVTGVAVTFNPVTNTIIFTFPTMPNGGALLNGVYRARLLGAGVFDAGGNNIGADQIVDFYFYNADANHDAIVDVNDLVALGTHWLQPSNFNYTFGDFDYDGDVDQHDLGILALNWPSGPPAPDAPNVLGSNFVWQNAPQRIEIVVDRDVEASLDSGDLVLENLSTGTTINTANITASWISATNTIVFSFPTLPNGRYRATLLGAGVTDASSNPLAADHVLEFFFINGDANHDGLVDVNDLVALGNNWLQPSSFSYTVGDFDYNGIVDQSDLGILAQNWQTSLVSLAPAVPASPVPISVQPSQEPAPEQPPATPSPSRTPTRTPTRSTPASTPTAQPAVVVAAPAQPTPQPAPEVPPAPASEAPPVVDAAPAPAVQPESPPQPVAEVETETPAPQPAAPVAVDQTPPPAHVDPAPITPSRPAPVVSQPQPTTPFANGPAIRSEVQPPPTRRTTTRTPLRAVSLVDL